MVSVHDGHTVALEVGHTRGGSHRLDMPVDLRVRHELIASMQLEHLLHRLKLAGVATLLQNVESGLDLLDETVLLLVNKECGKFF